MPFVFGEDPSNYGDSTAVQCMVFKGDTPLQLHWTLNGQPITNEHVGIRIIKMSPKLSSLSIDAISGHHRGCSSALPPTRLGWPSRARNWWSMVNIGDSDILQVVFCFLFSHSHSSNPPSSAASNPTL